MVWITYKEKVKQLSIRIVDAQKPIRILEAIKWDPSFEMELRKGKYKTLPKITPEYYEKRGIGFDPNKKIEEFTQIIQDIELTLGKEDAIGKLLVQIAAEYRDVIEMLKMRGTKAFWELSRKLYGSPKDHLYDEKNTISSLGQVLYSIFSGPLKEAIGDDHSTIYDAQQVVDILNKRFKNYFPDTAVEARISDGILADAAAGGDTIKIKEGSRFSERDVNILEVHEGWVHVGTTQNGMQQSVAKWLSKGPPRCAATQEGLAVIMEIFTFRTYPRRARKINDRIISVEKAEDGANLLDIIEFYRTEGYSEEDCLSNAIRIFRGGVIEGGAPFTKDISYCRGFVENYNFMRSAIHSGKPYLLPFLFTGKLHADDVPLIYQKYKEGIIDYPKYLPSQFRDLNGVAVWMGFSNFFNMIDLKKVHEHYQKLFNNHV